MKGRWELPGRRRRPGTAAPCRAQRLRQPTYSPGVPRLYPGGMIQTQVLILLSVLGPAVVLLLAAEVLGHLLPGRPAPSTSTASRPAELPAFRLPVASGSFEAPPWPDLRVPAGPCAYRGAHRTSMR